MKILYVWTEWSFIEFLLVLVIKCILADLAFLMSFNGTATYITCTQLILWSIPSTLLNSILCIYQDISCDQSIINFEGIYTF